MADAIGAGSIQVDSDSLGAAGGQAGALRGELAALCGELDALRSGSGAAGSSEVGGAIEECCAGWYGAVVGLEAFLGQLGSNLSAAGGSYETTDCSVMPKL